MSKLRGFFLFLSFCVSLFASDVIYPFVAYSSYTSSFKTHDVLSGVYGSFSNADDTFYFGYEYKDTKASSDTNTSDTNTTNIADTNTTNNSSYNSKQHDFIVRYTKQLSTHVALDVAGHISLSTLAQTDLNQIYLIGLSYTKKERFSFGVDLSYSLYNNYSLADDLYQVSPYFGLWYGDRFSRMGKVQMKLTYNYINPSNTNVALAATYNNFEIALKQVGEHFINIFAYSFGKNINIVKDKGFTVYMNNEIHNQGMILSSALILSADAQLKLSYIMENFDEYDPYLSSMKQDATMHRFVLSGFLRF